MDLCSRKKYATENVDFASTEARLFQLQMQQCSGIWRNKTGNRLCSSENAFKIPFRADHLAASLPPTNSEFFAPFTSLRISLHLEPMSPRTVAVWRCPTTRPPRAQTFIGPNAQALTTQRYARMCRDKTRCGCVVSSLCPVYFPFAGHTAPPVRTTPVIPSD